MQQKLSENRASETPDADYDKLGRDALIALLRSAIQQRDEVVSKYEAMAYQVDDSTREIDDALLDARRKAEEAEKNERQAQDNERRAREQEALVHRLEGQLETERGKNAALAADFARYRERLAKTLDQDPWGHLGRALAQIGDDGVVWTRSKIPPDSQLLPWFDRAVDGAKKAGRTAGRWAGVAYDWAKPRAIELYEWARPRAIDGYKWARGEVERRWGKAER